MLKGMQNLKCEQILSILSRKINYLYKTFVNTWNAVSSADHKMHSYLVCEDAVQIPNKQ